MSSDNVAADRSGTTAIRRSGAMPTSKALIFLAAFLSFLLSVYLFFSGDHERGIFVGLWVPSILSAGTLLLTQVRHG